MIFPFIATLTIGTLEALGFPYGSRSARATIEIEVVESNGRSSARYVGEGSCTKFSAFYWGFSPLSDPFGSSDIREVGGTCHTQNAAFCSSVALAVQAAIQRLLQGESVEAGGVAASSVVTEK